MPIKSYRDLTVWQKAMDVVEMVYRTTQSFPKEELYGLTQQVRRAAVSIPSNVAEGQGRTSTKEFLNFLSISHGSLCEAETQLLIAQRLRYVDVKPIDTLMDHCGEVGRLLNGLIRALQPK